MRRISSATMVIVGAATLVACSGPAMSPGSPTPTPTPSTAVTSIAVTSAPPTGSTFQLTAMARLSDGSSRNVTSTASWSSSNLSIATVSPSGLATIVGSGDVELRATYQSVVGSIAMDLGSGFTVSGLVHEVGPANAPESGVRISIVRGVGNGTTVTSDASGAYHLDRVSGVVDIQATKDGFVAWRVSNLTVDHDMTVEVGLYPVPPANAAGQTATARCQDGAWSWAQTLAEACTANGGIMYGVCPGVLCAATRTVR